MSLAARLEILERRIVSACAAVSRPRESVRLIAVSKKHPPEAIRAAYALGLRDFGENYAQELEQKAKSLTDLPELRLHFIGHLQSNKAKSVAAYACSIQTIDSPFLAREVAKRARSLGRHLEVLIEVNVGGEAQKHGCKPEDLDQVIKAIVTEPDLTLRGLMTMPPAELDAAKKAFDTLRTLQSLHGGSLRLPELSMGMSDDLEVAIASGATMVRIGTALFGSRPQR
jgi:PLP dependent protein